MCALLKILVYIHYSGLANEHYSHLDSKAMLSDSIRMIASTFIEECNTFKVIGSILHIDCLRMEVLYHDSSNWNYWPHW